MILSFLNTTLQWVGIYKSVLWAIDQDSVGEVGCIHTCQGLEFDYVGVIIGPDISYNDQEVN